MDQIRSARDRSLALSDERAANDTAHLGDVFGASPVSGFAGNAAALIAARAAQGLGAALMTPDALSIVLTMYSGAQRTGGVLFGGASPGRW